MYVCVYIYIYIYIYIFFMHLSVYLFISRVIELHAHLDPPASQCKIHCTALHEAQGDCPPLRGVAIALTLKILKSCSSATSSPVHTPYNPVPLYGLYPTPLHWTRCYKVKTSLVFVEGVPFALSWAAPTRFRTKSCATAVARALGTGQCWLRRSVALRALCSFGRGPRQAVRQTRTD